MKLKYREYYRIEIDPNGGASICHLYWDEINHFDDNALNEISEEFIKVRERQYFNFILVRLVQQKMQFRPRPIALHDTLSEPSTFASRSVISFIYHLLWSLPRTYL